MIRICVAYATPQVQVELRLCVEPDCTVIRAIKQSGILQRFPELRIADLSVGIFSKKVLLDSLLNDGDRIEIYRPLLIDPKQARKQRAIP